jgi:hypothetical protein
VRRTRAYLVAFVVDPCIHPLVRTGLPATLSHPPHAYLRRGVLVLSTSERQLPVRHRTRPRAHQMKRMMSILRVAVYHYVVGDEGELAPSQEQIRSAIKSGCSRCRKCPTPSIIWNDDPAAGK